MVGKEVPVLLDMHSSGQSWGSHCFLWVSLGKEDRAVFTAAQKSEEALFTAS